PVPVNNFDSREIFAIYHERDLRQRPTTSRSEYVRACVEHSLSPIPVFDHLQPIRSRLGERPEDHGEEGGDAERTPVFGLDLRSYGLGPKRSLALAAFLRTFCSVELRSFDIEGCDVPESAMVAVLRALRGGKGLEYVNISANTIKREDTAHCVS
ncbi:unnamed protein product, partial [Sphacelaria rigidula]